jgi:hypothetical protein
MHTNNPPKRSRSPGYDAKIAKTICLRLVNRESLRSICADPRMPAKATVCRWLARNQEFRRWYALARASQVLGRLLLQRPFVGDAPYGCGCFMPFILRIASGPTNRKPSANKECQYQGGIGAKNAS